MNDSISSARPHTGALVSFLLGLSSLVLGLFALTGLPALVVGLRSLRTINASEGRLGGARLAKAGVFMGVVSTLLTVLGVGALVIVRWQDASRRVGCANHLRQIGVALNKYAEVHGSFPPATRTPPELSPDKRISWMADVLPLLDEGRPSPAQYSAVYERIDLKAAWDDPANVNAVNTQVRIFRCPGHPQFHSTIVPAPTHYVGMAGVGPDAAFLKREDPRAGMFGHDRGVTRKEIEGGISFTFMVLETAQDNGPWLAGGWPTVRDLDPDADQYAGPGLPFGGLHHLSTNILWVDGSVRPLANDTPGEVFRAHATLRRAP